MGADEDPKKPPERRTQQTHDLRGASRLRVEWPVDTIALELSTDGMLHVDAYLRSSVGPCKLAYMSVDAQPHVQLPERAGGTAMLSTNLTQFGAGQIAAASLLCRVPTGVSVEVITDAARVRAVNFSCDIEVESVIGDVELEDCAGRAEITTANGHVTIRRPREAVTIKSENGRVLIDCDRKLDGNIDIHTINGMATLNVASDGFKARFRVETESGDIEAAPNPGLKLLEKRSLGSYSAQLNGGGGPMIHAQSVNGSIQLFVSKEAKAVGYKR
ncbi:MAG: DUF4097 family beta strand repeat-containing protein [Phycisphaerae bacterium]|nr:DUF4097 family beta strand repeat-containing protein [Phycisphaerae bacterium]